MHHTIIPRHIDPEKATRDFERVKTEAERMLTEAQAQTPDKRREAQFWIDYADRNLTKLQRGQR